MFVIGVIFVITIVYLLLSESWLKQRFAIERKDGLFVKFINKQHMIIEIILLVIAIVGIFLFSSKGLYGHYWVFAFFITILIVRSIMQWIYERERKEYILELNSLLAFIVLFILIIVIY